MFEVIISTVNSGKVRRKLFESHERAQRYIDDFFAGKFSQWKQPLSPRNYRVEVHARPLPVVRRIPAPVAAKKQVEAA
jgi:hypothetical protein